MAAEGAPLGVVREARAPVLDGRRYDRGGFDVRELAGLDAQHAPADRVDQHDAPISAHSAAPPPSARRRPQKTRGVTHRVTAGSQSASKWRRRESNPRPQSREGQRLRA